MNQGEEQWEDNKRVIRSRKSTGERQYNDQRKRQNGQKDKQ